MESSELTPELPNTALLFTPHPHAEGPGGISIPDSRIDPDLEKSTRVPITPAPNLNHHPSTNALLSQLEAAMAAGDAHQDQYPNDPTAALITSHISNLNAGARDSAEAGLAEPARAWLSSAQKGQDMEDARLPSQKDSVRALRKYTTLTNAEIFRRVGVSTSGGYRYLRGEGDKDPGKEHKETRGRKRKLDEDVVKRVIHEIEYQPIGEKTKSWEELCKLSGLPGIAPVTLKRAIENAGYYKCSHCQRVTKAHGVSDKGIKEPKEAKDGKGKEARGVAKQALFETPYPGF